MPRAQSASREHRRWPACTAAAALTISVSLLSACGATPGSSATTGRTTTPATPRTTATSSTGAVTTVAAAPETNTPGDIPDTIGYVPYANTAGHYTFVHPEGWAQTGQGTHVLFTDKYNGVSADSAAATSAPTVASAQSTDVPQLKGSVPAFELRSVAPLTLPGGVGVLIVYRNNSAPDAVTGRVVRDETQRYEIYANGRVVTLDLFGALGADNVDPYARMSQSLRIT